MILSATILEEMTRELIEAPTAKINYRTYQKKVKRYQPTLDGMMDNFMDTVFGEYSNRRTKTEFIDRLS